MASVKLRAACAAALVFGGLVTSQPADARRWRIPIHYSTGHSGGGSETIDFVYDLPDNDTYTREVTYANLGYLHGNSAEGYVLYSGSRYTLLEPAGLQKIKDDLGFDPTEKYRREHEAEFQKKEAAKAQKEQMIAQGRMVERADGESSENYAARKADFIQQIHAQGGTVRDEGEDGPASVEEPSSFGLGGIVLLLVGLGVVIFLIKLAIKPAQNWHEMDYAEENLTQTAAQRVAMLGQHQEEPSESLLAQRIGVQNGEIHVGARTGESGLSPSAPQVQHEWSAPPSAASSSPAFAAPPAGGFGRKVV